MILYQPTRLTSSTNNVKTFSTLRCYNVTRLINNTMKQFLDALFFYR